MSIESGLTVGYVYVTEDGLNGRTLEALETTREHLAADESAHPKMTAAFDEIIESSRSLELRLTIGEGDKKQTVVKQLIKEGRYLLGTSLVNYDDVEAPFDGLFYAEAEGLMESGAFSAVRMGTWVRRAVSFSHAGHSLSDYMTRMGLADVAEGGMVWGVPVERLTRITDLDSNYAYRYGQKAELDAVTALKLPEPLKSSLVAATQNWHLTEIHAGPLPS